MSFLRSHWPDIVAKRTTKERDGYVFTGELRFFLKYETDEKLLQQQIEWSTGEIEWVTVPLIRGRPGQSETSK